MGGTTATVATHVARIQRTFSKRVVIQYIALMVFADSRIGLFDGVISVLSVNTIT